MKMVGKFTVSCRNRLDPELFCNAEMADFRGELNSYVVHNAKSPVTRRGLLLH